MKMYKADILAYLIELDESLPEFGADLHVDVKVAGGAALAFYWDNRGTLDIDIAYPTDLPSDIKAAADQIARKHKLPEGWLNTSVAFLDKPKEFLFNKNMYRGKRFQVYVPDKETLFAMKICAGRAKDIDDAVRLAEEIGITASEDIESILRGCYTDRIVDAIKFENKDFIGDVLAETANRF